ncbi:MAG: Gfo/Idh/MocA family oxidoreductase [Chloroflexota bacterium]
MSKIKLAIVGCGGMGHRHLRGLAELHRNHLSHFDVVAACDPVAANANSLADEAAEHFGTRPAVVANFDELAKVGVDAVDITTTPPYHHTLAVDALAHGWHAMIEKPVGLTVRACNLIRAAAQQSDRVVSVAENYRRDPINRMIKALLDAGVIGQPRLMFHNMVGGGNNMTISVWRHKKDQSGVILDVGVHFTDMMEYFLGDITHVYAQTRLHEPIRYNAASGDAAGNAEGATSNPAGVYGKWQKDMPATFEATAEDAAYATLTFANGAVCQYTEDHAGHGKGMWVRQIHGSAGSMDLPNDRSGQRMTLYRPGETPISEAGLLELVPDFHLDKATATLFGSDRMWHYELPFVQTDRKLIAVEYADFAGAILGEHPIDVDIDQGTRSVAIAYAMLESGVAGRTLTVDEVLNEEVDAYQQDINESMGI